MGYFARRTSVDVSESAVSSIQARAEAGDPDAQVQLALMGEPHLGHASEDSPEIRWLKQAAEAGHAQGQYLLGLWHHRESLDRSSPNQSGSRLDAYFWLRLAADQEHPEADAGWERVTLTMTRQEIAAGNLRVTAFKHRAPIGK
jgi:TPR repeat protein